MTSKRQRNTISETNSYDESDVLYPKMEHQDPRTFKPPFFLATWDEPRTTTKRISLAILLPSGIEPRKFSYSVNPDDRSIFEMSVLWPNPLVDMEVLHRKWITSEGDHKILSYHSKITAFESSLKQLRKRSGDSVSLTAQINLPHSVEIHIYENYNLEFRASSSKIVYVELKAAMDSYVYKMIRRVSNLFSYSIK